MQQEPVRCWIRFGILAVGCIFQKLIVIFDQSGEHIEYTVLVAYSFGEKMTDRLNQIYRYATQGNSLNGQTYTSQGGYNAAGTGSVLDTVM